MRAGVDAHIAASGLAAAAAVPDPAEAPVSPIRTPRQLDLRAEGVSCVVWATGFGADYSWLRVPIVDERGLPRQAGGATAASGIFVVGLPWMTHRASATLAGVRRDAAAVAGRILGRELRLAA